MASSIFDFTSSLNFVLWYVGLILIIYVVTPCCSKNNSVSNSSKKKCLSFSLYFPNKSQLPSILLWLMNRPFSEPMTAVRKMWYTDLSTVNDMSSSGTTDKVRKRGTWHKRKSWCIFWGLNQHSIMQNWQMEMNQIMRISFESLE